MSIKTPSTFWGRASLLAIGLFIYTFGFVSALAVIYTNVGEIMKQDTTQVSKPQNSPVPIETALTEELPLIPDLVPEKPEMGLLDPNEYPTVERIEEIQDEIYDVAGEMGFADIYFLYDLATCESSFRQFVRGDQGHSRGIYQIHDIDHSEVSDDCSFSIDCSTRWTIQRILDGYDYEWACTGIIEDSWI
jgi:hypothetical protein|tara:strand:+ start:5123 stop:5692 length:570 start_codon:yes stop_codon:yes gene_type:complete